MSNDDVLRELINSEENERQGGALEDQVSPLRASSRHVDLETGFDFDLDQLAITEENNRRVRQLRYHVGTNPFVAKTLAMQRRNCGV